MFKTRTSLRIPLILVGATALLLSACITDDEKEPEGEPSPTRQMLLDSGAVAYNSCSGCHGTSGEGGRGPVLANSDYVMGSKERIIRTVLNGLIDSDTIVVNGDTIVGGGMPFWRSDVTPVEEGGISDFNIAAILTYIRVTMNDSLVTGCTHDPQAGTVCTFEARSEADILSDSVSVEMVTAVRDTLAPPETF